MTTETDRPVLKFPCGCETPLSDDLLDKGVEAIHYRLDEGGTQKHFSRELVEELLLSLFSHQE